MNTEGKIKRLNLMRYWLFGTFVIVFAGLTVYLGLLGLGLSALQVGPVVVGIQIPIWVIVGILCVATYYGYKFLYLKRANVE